MLEALNASRSASSGAVAQPKKGKGRGKGKATGDEAAKMVLKKLLPVVVSLDRRVQALEDRATYVVVLTDEKYKSDVHELRQLWRKQEKERRDAFGVALEEWKQAGSTGAKPTLPNHPLGGSQRSAVFKCFLEKANQEIPQDHAAKAQVATAAASSLAQVDGFIYRATPRHPEPKDGRPWVWAFMLQETATAVERSVFPQLASVVNGKFKVAPQHQQDGPLLKWLLAWMSKTRGPSDRQIDEEVWGSAAEEEDERIPKRTRNDD